MSEHDIRVNCGSCFCKTNHKVLCDHKLSIDNPTGSWSGREMYQVIQCLGCNEISFRHATWEQGDHYQLPDGSYEENIYQRLYPERVNGRAGLDLAWEESESVPQNLQRIYQETLAAINNEMPVIAGIGIRAIVETICKDKSAAGRNLSEKIDGLVDLKYLTPSGADALHKLRVMGNKSAHEVKPHSMSQLSIAMDVVDHLVNDLYILPGRLNAEFP
jgi:hypothetical protein